MAVSKLPAWPLRQADEDGQPLALVKLGDLGQFNGLRQGIVAMTDGWAGEPVAAVLRGGVNASAVLDVLHRSGVTNLDIYHLEERLPQLEEVFLSSVVARAHQLFEDVHLHWRHDPNVFDLVKSLHSRYKMLLFGAPLAVSEIMPFYERIKEVWDGGVTIVRGPSSDVGFTGSDEICKWVRKRTFDGADFSLPEVLRRGKASLGVKVAVVLPSLNEEKTVGDVIKAALEVKEAGLIDEVILVDSGSVDGTTEIARTLDIPVYLHREIRSDLGTYHGKGEAMFKSAFVTDADVIAWVDTDISSIAPRFFYGLLGPILTDPEVRFVKGYFTRPVVVEPGGVELGGGRVTEILMRPWISAFMPQLSGYIQPLAGTVATYRDLLLGMRLPTNYGVEIAMLLQAVKLGSLWSTGQVNLGEVVHRSKDVNQLGEMSFQILQVLGDLMGLPLPYQDVLRRVYSAHGHFEIGLKRFQTQWRTYPPALAADRPE